MTLPLRKLRLRFSLFPHTRNIICQNIMFAPAAVTETFHYKIVMTYMCCTITYLHIMEGNEMEHCPSRSEVSLGSDKNPYDNMSETGLTTCLQDL